jgi:hypothetical protein
VIEEALAAAQQDGHDRQVELADQARPEVLLDGGGAAPQPDVVAVGRLDRSLEGRLDAVVDEVERRSSLHRDRRAWVVGEDEHRVVGASFLLVAGRVAFRWMLTTRRSEGTGRARHRLL